MTNGNSGLAAALNGAASALSATIFVGARVRVCAGRASGHDGVIVAIDRSSAEVRLPHGGGMSDATLRVPIDDLLAIAPPRTTAPAWRPWAPPRFRPPRAGSADQSRLPSLAGDSLIYPRGLV